MQKDYVSSIFGQNLFTDDVMREYLPKPIYLKLKRTIEENVELVQQ